MRWIERFHKKERQKKTSLRTKNTGSVFISEKKKDSDIVSFLMENRSDCQNLIVMVITEAFLERIDQHIFGLNLEIKVDMPR